MEGKYSKSILYLSLRRRPCLSSLSSFPDGSSFFLSFFIVGNISVQGIIYYTVVFARTTFSQRRRTTPPFFVEKIFFVTIGCTVAHPFSTARRLILLFTFIPRRYRSGLAINSSANYVTRRRNATKLPVYLLPCIDVLSRPVSFLFPMRSFFITWILVIISPSELAVLLSSKGMNGSSLKEQFQAK